MSLLYEMAKKAEEFCINKAFMGWKYEFLLAILAETFIAIGEALAKTVTDDRCIRKYSFWCQKFKNCVTHMYFNPIGIHA